MGTGTLSLSKLFLSKERPLVCFFQRNATSAKGKRNNIPNT
jgi:hypothetical protein